MRYDGYADGKERTMINRIALKGKAKEVVNLNMWNLMLGYALAVLLPVLIAGGATSASSSNALNNTLNGTTTTQGAISSNPSVVVFSVVIAILLLILATFVLVLAFASFLARSLASSSYQRICLKAYDGTEVKVESLVDVKEYWSKLLWLNFCMWLRIFAWSLLFIIPGIVAAYSYAAAPYFLFDDPDKDPLQCINESKMLMRGRRQELFVLDLSFFPWWCLVLVTGGIAAFYVTPYISVTRAGFYREVRSNMDQFKQYLATNEKPTA
jgi:uncharacterized membrane protein